MNIDKCICVEDFERLAAKKLSKKVSEFISIGATNEQTLKENCSAFKSWRFQPKVLRDVSQIDTSSFILGSKIAFPVCIAPFGLHKMASKNGEIDTARAAESVGTGFVMGTWSSCTIEQIAEKVPKCLRWFQLYVVNDRDVVKTLIQRAEQNGYCAIVVTVDVMAVGKRFTVLRNELSWRQDLPPGNFEDGYLNRNSENDKDVDLNIDQTINWDDIDWIRSITNLPIIIKGIITVEMALEAVDHEVDGIIVSNHGGRCLDSTLPAIHALPKIMKSVKGRCEIYLDSGIRNGADVVKAIALGAKAVFVGRPILWGLTCAGEEGARRVLEILRDEFETTMKLLGVVSIADLQSNRDLVVYKSKLLSQL
uniref:hydroxyacid oxidase 2-like n=1 Tax=Styela clava TaxID=7725 RepID=UPI00193A1DC5|nr:hydroxyacid oxidase 2-like [Styela clava]